MESDELFYRITAFLRSNLLLISFIGLALIFIFIGIVQLFTSVSASRSDSGVEIITSDVKAAEDSTGADAVIIDISGAVLKPGVYSFTSESRIGDAIKKAGGLTEDADVAYIEQRLNLAQKITDGMKLFIPRVGDQAVAGVSSSTTSNSSVSGLISINSATEKELDSLPGVGVVTAGKIIAGRPYVRVEDLVEKKVVSVSIYEKIKDKVSL